MIKVEVVSYTPEPELIVAVAARSCLADENFGGIRGKLRQSDISRILATVISKGHHSVLEHASFTFSISGVSRVLTHQLVRHRIASYSQLSQQRSNASQLDFVTPPEIQKNTQLAEEYREMMHLCQGFYQRLVTENIHLGSARYVLPSGFTTRIVVTMNARSLFNLLAQRECAAEEWEFRQVATLMHRELLGVAPGIFRYAGAPCQTEGVCPEGELGEYCGRRLRTGAVVTNTRDDIERVAAEAVSAELRAV